MMFLLQLLLEILLKNKLAFTTTNFDGSEVYVTLSSSIPNQFQYPEKGVIRWETLFHLMIYEPQADGTKIIQAYTQIDPNLHEVSTAMINRTLEYQFIRWYNSLREYLDSLHS